VIDNRIFKDMMKQIKYFETTNERDFFISANLLFEKLFDDKIRYETKKPDTHHLRMKNLFSRLEFLDEPMFKNIHNFLILLNRYRNELSHNFEAEKELNILKEELLSEIKNIFINGFSLSKDFKFDKNNVEILVKNKIKNNDLFKKEKFFKEDFKEYQKILKDIPKEDRNTPIESFDNVLFMQIITIYSGFIGLLIGLDSKNNSL